MKSRNWGLCWFNMEEGRWEISNIFTSDVKYFSLRKRLELWCSLLSLVMGRLLVSVTSGSGRRLTLPQPAVLWKRLHCAGHNVFAHLTHRTVLHRFKELFSFPVFWVNCPHCLLVPPVWMQRTKGNGPVLGDSGFPDWEVRVSNESWRGCADLKGPWWLRSGDFCFLGMWIQSW